MLSRCLGWAAGASIVVSGCTTSGAMRCPAEGGAAWREVSTTHFRVQTDLDEPDARKAAVELENRRSGLVAAAWHGAEFPDVVTRVVLLRGWTELREFVYWTARSRVEGYSTYDWFGDKLIVLSRDEGGTMQVFNHELTHDLGRFYFARQPSWLSEGMAEFLETLQVDEQKQTVVVGIPDLTNKRDLTIATRRLFAQERANRGADVHSYLTGWLLVFYLANYEGAAFNEYQKGLFRGESLDRAWNAAFPQYATAKGLDQLDRKLRDAFFDLRSTQKYKTASAHFVPYAGPVSVRGMTDTEVHVVRAELLLRSPTRKADVDDNLAKARVDAVEALRQEPGDVGALAIRIQLTKRVDERLAIAEQAARAHPEDFRALLLDDLAEGDEVPSTDRERARVARLELAARLSPDNAWVLTRLARGYVRADRFDEATPLLQHALEIMPDNPAALDAYALVARAKQSCPAALQFERMAVERLPHSGASRGAGDSKGKVVDAWRDMRHRLRELEKECGGPQAADATAR